MNDFEVGQLWQHKRTETVARVEKVSIAGLSIRIKPVKVPPASARWVCAWTLARNWKLLEAKP